MSVERFWLREWLRIVPALAASLSFLKRNKRVQTILGRIAPHSIFLETAHDHSRNVDDNCRSSDTWLEEGPTAARQFVESRSEKHMTGIRGRLRLAAQKNCFAYIPTFAYERAWALDGFPYGQQLQSYPQRDPWSHGENA